MFIPQMLCFFNGVFNLFYAPVFLIWEQGVGNKQKQRFLIEQYFETLLLVLNLLWFYVFTFIIFATFVGLVLNYLEKFNTRERMT